MFLSANLQHCANHKEKPGMFGIVMFGKDSGKITTRWCWSEMSQTLSEHCADDPYEVL